MSEVYATPPPWAQLGFTAPPPVSPPQSWYQASQQPEASPPRRKPKSHRAVDIDDLQHLQANIAPGEPLPGSMRPPATAQQVTSQATPATGPVQAVQAQPVQAQPVQTVQLPKQRKPKKKKNKFRRKLRKALPWIAAVMTLLFLMTLAMLIWQFNLNKNLRASSQSSLTRVTSMAVTCDQVTVEWTQISRDWQDVLQDLKNATHATILNDPTTATDLNNQVNEKMAEIAQATKLAQAHSVICAHGDTLPPTE